ncbi:hypothetical protein [Mangrovibacterium sp.]|uniref:hypothetical protein n=1 Tax=Mangrovibacterium sp. TaxID=1961364 RepID=UPI003566291F
MNETTIFILKALRKVNITVFGRKQKEKPKCETNPNAIANIIYNAFMQDKPCMIARYGSTELSAVLNYLGVKQKNKDILKFIRGETPEWWWNKNILNQMQQWSGFFPPTEKLLEQFGELMIEDSKFVDILGSWQSDERLITTLPKNHIKVQREPMNPFFADRPWTHALESKNVLVVHPFAESIKQQYKIKDKIFPNGILPNFNLIVIPAVQSIGGKCGHFNDWFEALDFMKNAIDSVDYDICLLGCGAYGFPLAAHVKRNGKKAFHLGGSLQLLFGIKGARWEDPNYNSTYNYARLMNEHWIKPNEKEKPSTAEQVEGACYW